VPIRGAPAWRFGARHRSDRDAARRRAQYSRGHPLSTQPAGRGSDDGCTGAGAARAARGAQPEARSDRRAAAGRVRRGRNPSRSICDLRPLPGPVFWQSVACARFGIATAEKMMRLFAVLAALTLGLSATAQATDMAAHRALYRLTMDSD